MLPRVARTEAALHLWIAMGPFIKYFYAPTWGGLGLIKCDSSVTGEGGGGKDHVTSHYHFGFI